MEKQTNTTDKQEKGVVYVGHIPHGFYEKSMSDYFSQFGKVNRVKLSRSNKTGKSKGYGFVEFADATVAKIAADAMNGYLMFHRLLKCEYIPQEKLSRYALKGAKNTFKPTARIAAVKRVNCYKDADQVKKSVKRIKRKTRKHMLVLKAAGVDYDVKIRQPDEDFSTSKENKDVDLVATSVLKPETVESQNEDTAKQTTRAKRKSRASISEDTPVEQAQKRRRRVSSGEPTTPAATAAAAAGGGKKKKAGKSDKASKEVTAVKDTKSQAQPAVQTMLKRGKRKAKSPKAQ